jgi:hypothetical protein
VFHTCICCALVRLIPCVLFSPSPFPSPFQQLSVGCLMPPSFSYMVYFGIFPYPIILCFSPFFLIPPPQTVPLLQSWCCIYACISLHMYVRSWFSIWGNMWPLSFWTWLTLLNMLISSSIPFPANATFHSSLWLNNSPLCKYTKFHFMCSLIRGHLGWFQDLAMMNSTAISMGVQMSILIPTYISSAISPRVELLGHMVVLFLVQGSSILLSVVVALSLSSHQQCIRVHFLHILPGICCFNCWC